MHFETGISFSIFFNGQLLIIHDIHQYCACGILLILEKILKDVHYRRY